MISSKANAQVKAVIQLQKSAKRRYKEKLFVAEGLTLLKEAAEYGRLQKAYLSKSASEKHKATLTALEGCPCETVSDTVFAAMAGTVTPQGALGLVQMPEYDFLAIAADNRKSFLLLEDLRDPGNLGTIFRAAEGAGMAGVILSRESVDLFNPKTVRSTMGSVFRMPFCYVPDLADAIQFLKKRQIPVYGARMQGSIPYDKADYRNGAGIVIGSEAKGISQNVAKHLTATVCIPMAGKLESLNAAVSAAVILYEMARQRRNVARLSV